MIEVITRYWILFVLAGTTIVLALSWYSFLLMRRLRHQTQSQTEKRNKLLRTCIDSATTIIAATLQQQCNLSEATLRLFAIVDTLNQYSSQRIELSEFRNLSALYDVVQDHPILEARKQLPKKDRMKLDLTRESLEAELESKILMELKELAAQLVDPQLIK